MEKVGIIITFLLIASRHVSVSQDCWTEWSPYWNDTCFSDSSSNTAWKDRILKIYPGQANGTTCQSGDYVYRIEQQPCEYNPSEALQEWQQLTCDDTTQEHYKCANGRCIRIGLQCNGDDDCGDASDEYPYNKKTNCSAQAGYICGVQITTTTSATPPKSDRWFLGISGVEKFAVGYDILTGKLRGNVLSMGPFGSCRRVLKAGETDYYYRLPGNVNSFTQVYTVNEKPGKVVTTAPDMIRMTQNLLMMDPRVGGIITGKEGVVGLSQADQFKEYILSNVNDLNKYVAVTTTTTVRVFNIKLKDPKLLELSTSFIQRVCELPDDLSYQKYITFLMDYGTHYLSAATLGGSYSETTIYNRCWLEENYEYEYGNSKWRENLLVCQNDDFRMRLNSQNKYSSVCFPLTGSSNITQQAISSYVNIMGGTVSPASDLKVTFSAENWKAWVDSVADSPTFTLDDYELENISSLIDIPSLPLNNERRLNIKKNIDLAIAEYLRPYDAEELCSSDTFVAYCQETCGYEDDDTQSNSSLPYLTGRGGAEYKCLCACERAPSAYDEVCSSLRVTSCYVMSFLLCLITSMKNFW